MGRYLVGVSGASGSILAVRLLELLRQDPKHEIHLIPTQPALRTLRLELPELGVEAFKALAHEVHDVRDIAAAPASGGFPHDGMVIIPCSLASASALACGLGQNLLIRAADVCLKERRNLVLVPRESPLHAGHLETLARLARLGACILPPMLGFYQHPKSVGDMVDLVVGRVLDQLGVQHGLPPAWPPPERGHD